MYINIREDVDTHIKTKMDRSILAVAAALLCTAAITFAGFPGIHHSSQKHADLDLTEITRIPGGPTLKPGTYRVVLLTDSSTPELGFYHDGKLVGQAPVNLINQDKKISQTEVLADTQNDHTQVVTEMDLSGWTERVTFGAAHPGISPGK
jgi:hypothetical protein